MSKRINKEESLTRLQQKVREAADWSEFTYKDDPGYQAFCIAIMDEVENQEIVRPGKNGPEPDTVRHNKLYAAWHIASTFRMHWQHPTKRSENDMLWILYNRGWSYAQAIVGVIAWWRVHHRNITEAMLLDLEDLAKKVQKEVQQKKSNENRQKQQNSLRNRIIAMLRQSRATTAYLAEKLNATSKSVDSHLYRLRKKGIVERLSWGLYGLRGASSTQPKPMHDESSVRPANAKTNERVASTSDLVNLDDIEDGILEPRVLKSLPYHEEPSVESQESEDSTWDVLELPTAEPRWGRL